MHSSGTLGQVLTDVLPVYSTYPTTPVVQSIIQLTICLARAYMMHVVTGDGLRWLRIVLPL